MFEPMAQTATTKRKRRAAGTGYSPEVTRRALIDSAVSLFGEQGYAATSVQEITDAAGVTKGAFYHHFEHKEDLLRLIHDDFVDYYLSAMEDVVARYPKPDEQLAELIKAFVPIVESYQASLRVFLQEQRYLTGARFAAVKAKRDRFDELWQDVLNRGIEQGLFRDDLDPRVVGLGIIGMLSWIQTWYRPGGRYTAEEVGRILGTLVLDGLKV